ncbi:MAG: trifunctional dihydropteroate synthetase [Stictis urceolatum]|nr:trifunctional dihydropteroate synthetase [Stictis urceolata]
MYVEDQGAFVNGVCETHVGDMEPMELLSKVKAIEDKLGRRKTIDKGPRNIDLDILLKGNTTFSHPDLNVPHALMSEREFVLRPLSDLIPHATLPTSSSTVCSLLSSLPPSSPLSSLTPLTLTHHPSLKPLNPLIPTRRTHLMAILNLTPDSFSDGSQHSSSASYLLPLLQRLKAAGTTILDIGGQSTAPRAPEVSAPEELSRILPALKLIRSHTEFNDMVVSVDTYRASVARTAVQAGAEIVNDISGGTMDPDMLKTVAELGCSYILMHTRGTPETMARLTSYPEGLIPTIASELSSRLQAAEEAGIRRWRIILDPGIGFAKTQSQNCEILRRLGELREWVELKGYPWVVGASRKRFIGKITGVEEPRERVWGTATAVSASVAGGADVVRVHDVEEMAKVVRMGDAIWRVEDRK